jgi:hypothetical protein
MLLSNTPDTHNVGVVLSGIPIFSKRKILNEKTFSLHCPGCYRSTRSAWGRMH